MFLYVEVKGMARLSRKYKYLHMGKDGNKNTCLLSSIFWCIYNYFDRNMEVYKLRKETEQPRYGVDLTLHTISRERMGEPTLKLKNALGPSFIFRNPTLNMAVWLFITHNSVNSHIFEHMQRKDARKFDVVLNSDSKYKITTAVKIKNMLCSHFGSH